MAGPFMHGRGSALSWAPMFVRCCTRAFGFCLAFVFSALVVSAAGADAPASAEPEARVFLASVETSSDLQSFLDETMERLLASDSALRKQEVRVSVIDLPVDERPEQAGWNGDSPVYPASVVKFVYLMAAFEWRDRGELEIDPAFDRALRSMIYQSSNRATQIVLRRLTQTQAGPRLDPSGYEAFAERRHRVHDWLDTLGIDELHTVHPTYDGGGDLHGRDQQFLEDKTVEGSLPNQKGPYFNRQAMTADDTARLLALLAVDLALAPATSEEVRQRMRRDVGKQPYLAHRIAGGADRREDIEVYSKTGTWGPIFADAGIVRHASGHQFVLAAFIEGRPAYRGPFIARLTRALVKKVFPPRGKVNGRKRSP